MEKKSLRSKETSGDALGAHESLCNRCGVMRRLSFIPKRADTIVQMVRLATVVAVGFLMPLRKCML
jgi:hypothetical protein